MNALDEKGIDWLCDKLTEGATQRAICEELGIGIASLGRWIAAEPERSARTREARSAAAREFEERASEGIEAAIDAFALAKAKEMAHHLRWKASKANPREYGDKLEIDQRTTVTDLTEEQLDARLAALKQAESDALNAQQG